MCYSNFTMKKFTRREILVAIILSSFPGLVSGQEISTSTMVLASVHHKSDAQAKSSPNSSWFGSLGSGFSKIEHWLNLSPSNQYTEFADCSKKGAGYVWSSRDSACIQAPPGAKVRCLGDHEFWNGKTCVNSQAILKSKTATQKERHEALQSQREEATQIRQKCANQWGVSRTNSCVSLSKRLEKNPNHSLYVYIPCAVFFLQQHDQPNFACKQGDTFKLAKSIGLKPGLNRNVQFVFYGPAGYHPNQATKDYLCRKKTLAKNLAKSCLPLGKQVTFSAGVDSKNVHGHKKLHLTIYPQAGSIGYSNGSPSTVEIGNQYLGIPTGGNVFDVVVAKTPSGIAPKKKSKTPGSVAKNPPSQKNPGSGTPTKHQGNSCQDLKAQLAGAEAQIHACLQTLQKNSSMQKLIQACEKAEKKDEAECAANLPMSSSPTLVSKRKIEGNPALTKKISCTQNLGNWQARVFDLRKQIAAAPQCAPPPSDKKSKGCPKGEVFSAASGGGTCVPGGNQNNNPQGGDINQNPASNCGQASAPPANPGDKTDKNSTAKADSGNKTAPVDCGGQNQDKKSSWPKLPWKGMGLIGAYGGLLGALLLGPIGMFVFGVIGVGVGYLISK